MKKFVIACSGPSLRDHLVKYPVGGNDFVFAVNKARPFLKSANAWGILDISTFIRVVPSYRLDQLEAPLNIPDNWREKKDYRMCERALLKYKMHIHPYHPQEFLKYCGLESWIGELNALLYMKIRACCLSIKKGAKDIALYGDDMDGIGLLEKGPHSEGRWKRERRATERMIQLASEMDVKIERVT